MSNRQYCGILRDALWLGKEVVVHRNLHIWNIVKQRKRLWDRHNFIPSPLRPLLGAPDSVLYVDVWAVDFFRAPEDDDGVKDDLSLMLMLQLAYIAYTKLSADVGIRLFGRARDAEVLSDVKGELEQLVAEQRLERMTEVKVIPLTLNGEGENDITVNMTKNG